MVIPKITGYVSQSNDINELVNAVDIEWERSVIRDHFLNNYTLAQCMQNFHALINVYAQSNEKSYFMSGKKLVGYSNGSITSTIENGS